MKPLLACEYGKLLPPQQAQSSAAHGFGKSHPTDEGAFQSFIHSAARATLYEQAMYGLDEREA